jgi:Cft2 family RNA processing exonuclease
MRLTFLGGADEVGASCLLLEIGGKRLLIDAGIRPSPKARWGLAGDQLPDLSLIDHEGGIDALLVTHAHTDHTGALELVVGRYPDCPVYATPVTIALTRVLHADSRRIMRARLDEEGELPLFDEVATQKLLSAFVPVPFNTRLPLGDGVVATFYPAGHIAGAACIALESDEGRVLVSGDVSISSQRTVDGMRPPPFRPDVLILESTYGGRLHANRVVEERRLVATIADVVGDGGKVLIPAFALGRAQEVMLALGEFRRRGDFPDVPVWVDGMVRAVCQAYAQFPETLPLALQERKAQFFDERIRPIEQPDQRNALLFDPAPAVIISSSGMLAGGPSVQYARALAGQPQHAILLTGYQDEESPGRRLQEMAAQGKGTLRLGKDRIEVQCRLGTYSLSAHADEGQLISLTEMLDPSEVYLVHGDEAARDSLAKALGERGRVVRLPHAGQSFTFRYAPSLAAKRVGGVGAGKPLEMRALWQAVAEPGGGYFTLRELAQAWWGDDDHEDELETALARDDLYFTPDERRPQVYRARTAAQAALTLRRREQMAARPALAGQWLIVRDPSGEFRLGRCAERAVAADHFLLESDDAPHWPEEIADVIGVKEASLDAAAIESLAATLIPAQLLPPNSPRSLDDLAASISNLPISNPQLPIAPRKAALSLALLRAGAERTPEGYVLRATAPTVTRMEPNQALAFARAPFPPEARLRKCGYRLEQNVLTLTFDFPDAAQARYAEAIERARAATGWEIEVDPETNQGALNALVRETLPPEWQIVKGPAIYREGKRVAITVSSAAPTRVELNAACVRFQEISGWELSATVAVSSAPTRAASTPVAATAWEINAAYAEIKRALAGSTLYRTSLKGNEITLGFISPQVGERYREQIEALSARIGWPLAISPQPNQNAIMDAVRALVVRAGWTLVKGPSIFTDRAEVTVTVAEALDEAARGEAAQAFTEQTGYRLIFGAPTPPPSPAKKTEPELEVVEIPAARIRLTAYQQSLTLDPEKSRKALERAQREGRIHPPVRVRRVRDGYVLLDGLYRLQAAQALGWERIAAVVE